MKGGALASIEGDRIRKHGSETEMRRETITDVVKHGLGLRTNDSTRVPDRKKRLVGLHGQSGERWIEMKCVYGE